MTGLNAYGRPDPDLAGTPVELMDALRRLKDWTGLTYRQLEHRATAAGDVLPRTTLATALGRQKPPRQDLLAAFTAACGCTKDEVVAWLDAGRRLAAEPAALAELEADAPEAPVAAPRRFRAALATLVPPAIRQGSWSLRVLASMAALLVVVTVTGAAVQAVRDATGDKGGSYGGQLPEAVNDPSELPETPGPTATATPSAGTAGTDGSDGSGTSTGTPPGADPVPVPTPGTPGTTGQDTGEPPAENQPRAQQPPPAPAASPRPGTGSATAVVAEDTSVVKFFPDAANGHDTGLRSCLCGAGFGERWTLLKFHVTGVPAGNCAVTAKLRLWATTGPGAFVAHRVSADWTEEGASWNTRPTLGARLGTARGSQNASWVTFDLAGSYPNGTYAFRVLGEDDASADFAAREYSAVNRPAELITHYTCS